MTGARPLAVGVAELLRRPGTRRPLRRRVGLDHVDLSASAVPPGGEVEVDLVLESVGDGLVVSGKVTAPWEGDCRRCLELVRGQVDVPVREVFTQSPVEGETYALGADTVDLGPMVREAVLLALPLAPLCAEACAGPDPDEFPTGPASYERAEEDEAGERDPRWAALDALRFD